MMLKNKGFTLIEVLVALLVVSIIAVALSGIGQQVVQQHIRLEEKTFAHWVALNRWVTLQQENWPAIGSQESLVDMANRRWRVVTEVEASQQPHFRLVHIRVGPASEQEEDFHASTVLEGLLGEPLREATPL